MRLRSHQIFPLVLFLVGMPVSAQDVSTIYQESKNSIVLIVSYDSNMTPLGMGSGFYFRPGLIATNHHVIEGAQSFLVKNIGSNAEFRNVEVRSFSKKLDIAILETSTEGKALPITENGRSIGEQVVVIGNPRGLEGSVSTGIVSGIRPAGEYSIYQVTAPISPGSSGGPVFATDGSVMGIATFTLSDSQNLNFAMPTALLTELEKRKMSWDPPGAPRSPVTKRGNAGVELAEFIKEGPEFDENFSLRNKNTYAIENIVALLIYKSRGAPIDFKLIQHKSPIPPGLAKRIKQRSFDQSQDWTSDRSAYGGYRLFTVELRILNYDIVETGASDVFNAILN